MMTRPDVKILMKLQKAPQSPKVRGHASCELSCDPEEVQATRSGQPALDSAPLTRERGADPANDHQTEEERAIYNASFSVPMLF